MKIKNNETDKHKKVKDKLLKLGRGAAAMFLLGSHLMPGIVMASEMDANQNDGQIEDVSEINESKNIIEASDSEAILEEDFNAFPAPLDIDGENLLSDGDFEANNPEESDVWGVKNAKAGFDLDGNRVGFLHADTHDAFILQMVDTVPGDTYTFSANILARNIKGGDVAGVLLTTKEVSSAGEQGPVIEEISLHDTENDWEQVSVEFTATTSETFIGLVKWAEASNEDALNTEAIIDNASVVLTESNQKDDERDEQYELIWQDDFSTEELNQEYWGYELGNIRGNEQQHYTSSKDNVYIEDGNLVLQVTNRPEEDQYRNTDRLGEEARLVKYNSGSVRTHGKLEFLYGRIEARMRLPKGKGAFPAFWTLGSDFTLDGRLNEAHGYGWPQSGEIDIMEMIGAPTEERAAQGEQGVNGTSNQHIHGTAHFFYERVEDVDGDGAYGYVDSNNNFKGNNIAGGHSIDENYNDDFHVFGINWSPDKIEWFVDDVVYNTLTFEDPDDPENQARLDAAKMGLNRPQYIQLNLATGGNWPGEAGDFLAEDNTKVEIDWVKWSQTEQQQQAAAEYYANAPVLAGVQDITIIQGQDINFLENVSTDLADYIVDFSIEDEYMFENSGGRNEVTLIVEDSHDLEGLKNLEPGVYNIHYSAIPVGVTIHGRQYPEHPIARDSAVLTVLPEELTGVEGEPLTNIELPEGMEWLNSEQLLGDSATYEVIFRQLENTGTTDGNERRVLLEIPDEIIARVTSDDEENETPEEGEDETPEEGEDETPEEGEDEAPEEGEDEAPEAGENETPGADEDGTPGEEKEDEGDLPNAGEANTLAIILGGVVLVVIGIVMAVKARKETN